MSTDTATQTAPDGQFVAGSLLLEHGRLHLSSPSPWRHLLPWRHWLASQVVCRPLAFDAVVAVDEHEGSRATSMAAAARLTPKAKTDFMGGHYRWAGRATSGRPSRFFAISLGRSAPADGTGRRHAA